MGRTSHLITFVAGFLLVSNSSALFDEWRNYFDWDGFIGSPSGFDESYPTDEFQSVPPKFYNREVEYLTNLVSDAQQNGLFYKLPEDASEYEPKDDDIKDFGKFDFIIIGAGACGTVIANRLSEVSYWKVLLIEAGDFGDDLTDIPNMNLPLQFSKYNWGFVSTPQKTSCLGMEGRRCPMSRGKGIGGSTLINGLVYSRASSIDFDKWAKHVNDSRWSYPEVEHYFQKSEEFLHRDKKAPADDFAHGNSGELHVEYHLPRSPQLDAFLEANEELGLPIADYNAGIGLGASPSQLNTKFGRRVDGGKAFVQPILHRRNIKVLPNSYVTKILIDEHNVAYGIYFTHHAQKYVATVEKEVIVSAGSISTPHLLMLSGIGPRDHLRSKHIPLVQDLEVGSKLRDHPCFYGLNFETNYAEPVDTLTGYIKDYIKGVGPMTVPGNNQGVGFYESQFTKGTGYPDIEIMFIPANATSDLSQRAFRLTNQTYEDVWGRADRTRTYVMYVIALHAESTGTVRLRSKDPFDYPLIDTSFLSDPEDHDIELIYEGVQLALRLSDTDALQRLDATLQGGPLRACRHFKYPSRKYWYCAIRQLTMDVFHPVGTCPMGPYPDEGDVVDSKLRVHGVKNLRVADASVFPFTLAGHTSAVVVMVGEAASDILKEHWL